MALASVMIDTTPTLPIFSYENPKWSIGCTKQIPPSLCLLPVHVALSHALHARSSMLVAQS